MELRQLAYFEAVVRHRHFTRAAEELHVAQSALSRQVGRLERELGIELLRRSTRSVEATEGGAVVAARARAVLGEAEALRAEIDELRGVQRGHIRVGALLFGGGIDIPAILARFTQAFPEIELLLHEGTARTMIRMLGEGTLDLAFALERRPPKGLDRIAISEEQLALVTSSDHPLSCARPLPIAGLRGHPLIMFRDGSSTRELVDQAFADAGVSPRIAFEANDFALVRELVARGVGLAILPRSFVVRPGPEISHRPLVPPLAMTVGLWWRSGRRLSPAARAFVEFVQAASASGDSSISSG